MDISRERLLNIKNILAYIKNKKIDYEIINEIVDILRNDTIFDNPIDVEKIELNTPAYVMDGTLYYSDFMFRYAQQIAKRYSSHQYYNEVDAFNYMILEVLFHELAHLSQLDIALKRKSEYDVINDLYLLVYFGGHKDQNHYEKHRNSYVHEYNANLEALKLLRELYSNNKFLRNINNLQFEKVLGNYYDNIKKVFIAEKTLDFRHVEDKSIIKIYDDIPTGVLISNGLPIKDRELYKLSTRPLERTRRKYNL